LDGIRLILRRLVRRFGDLGGELRLRSAVKRIVVSNGRAERVVLADDTELEARSVLSSAGWPETMRLCGGAVARRPAGGLSIVESISALNVQPRALGHTRTIVFYNDSQKFHYQKPDEPADLRSGVICSPNNFDYGEPMVDGLMRITALANYDRWTGLDEADYKEQKRRWYNRLVASAVRFVPDFRAAVVDTDMFTPVTIRRFTGHEKGAIYGGEEKRYDGTTHLPNVYVCGNDQGLVGIIGTILSGINIANRYLLNL
jgi:phytoene dehydrogenase-like protein